MTCIAISSFAHVHAEAYARLLAAWTGVEPALVDQDGVAGAAEFAADLGIPLLDAAGLRDWNPDAVIVTSENVRHRRDVEQAAALGAHVLCEKPIATTREDAEAIVAACERAGIGLMMAFPVHFSPEAALLRRVVHEGGLGEVIGAFGSNTGKLPVAREWFSDPSLSGGGALVDHIVHLAELLDSAGLDAAVQVRAVGNSILSAERAHQGVETGALVTISYASGVQAGIDCSWSLPESAPTWGGLSLEVIGTAGALKIDPFGHRVVGVVGDGAAVRPYGVDADRAMLEAFLAAVRGSGPFAPDGAVGLRTLDIVLAAQTSAAGGVGAPVDVG